MTSGKSCVRCAKPLPADSLSELCKACTPDGQAVETPEEFKPIPSQPEELLKAENQFEETQTHFDPQVKPTDAAAGGRFNTDNANSVEEEPELGADQIKIDGYKLLSELGRGGCGIVFEALQLKTKRPVAVKILLGQSVAERIRFDREMRALGKLKDPRVIDVYETGQCNAGPFFTMERMEGGSLAHRLKTDGPMEPKKTAEMVESIARGMSAVHGAGLFHRDLKPGNILLDANGNPKLADFGLAKVYEAGADDTTAAKISVTRGIYGTPAFMAPEQAARRNSDVDARTDIYGIGGIFYQCLTGKAPFAGKNEYRLLERVIYERPTDPSAIRSGIPKKLEAICLKCLEKHPDARYQSALELANDLAAWQRGEETIARPATLLQRTGRWLNRQRRTMLIAGLVLAAAATINMAGAWMRGKQKVVPAEVPVQTETVDPDAELKKILAEIDTGEEVTLVPEQGLPRWYDRSNGNVEFMPTTYGDGACYFEAPKDRYVPLLRIADVPKNFKLKAKVRHEAGQDSTSSSGVRFGCNSFNSPTGEQRNSFYSFSINDETSSKDKDFPCHLSFRIGFDIYKKNEGLIPPEKVLAFLIMNRPIFGEPKPWREIELEFKNKSLILSSKYTGPKKFDETKISNELLEFHKNTLKNEPDPEHLSKNPFQGSLGIFVRKGAASFKNVRIQKIQ